MPQSLDTPPTQGTCPYYIQPGLQVSYKCGRVNLPESPIESGVLGAHSELVDSASELKQTVSMTIRQLSDSGDGSEDDSNRWQCNGCCSGTGTGTGTGRGAHDSHSASTNDDNSAADKTPLGTVDPKIAP